MARDLYSRTCSVIKKTRGMKMGVCQGQRDTACVRFFLLRPLSVPQRAGWCPQCGAILKPAIVFFGEDLPQEDFARATRAFQQGDLALVLGTSLQVTPASWLPAQRPRHSPLVILNREETWMDEEATLVLHDSVASLLSSCLREME